jgi:hypothetical protein
MRARRPANKALACKEQAGHNEARRSSHGSDCGDLGGIEVDARADAERRTHLQAL